MPACNVTQQLHAHLVYQLLAGAGRYLLRYLHACLLLLCTDCLHALKVGVPTICISLNASLLPLCVTARSATLALL